MRLHMDVQTSVVVWIMITSYVQQDNISLAHDIQIHPHFLEYWIPFKFCPMLCVLFITQFHDSPFYVFWTPTYVADTHIKIRTMKTSKPTFTPRSVENTTGPLPHGSLSTLFTSIL